MVCVYGGVFEQFQSIEDFDSRCRSGFLSDTLWVGATSFTNYMCLLMRPLEGFQLSTSFMSGKDDVFVRINLFHKFLVSTAEPGCFSRVFDGISPCFLLLEVLRTLKSSKRGL